MENVKKFLKKMVVISIFFSFFQMSICLYSQAKSNGSSSNSEAKRTCIDLVHGDGVSQMLMKLLTLQEEFKILLEEALKEQGDATAELESIVEDLENIAILLGITCPTYG